MIATAQIASLSSIRVLVLDQADACETTFAMQLRLRLARSLARLIEDLRQGVITLNERSFGIWGRIVLTDDPAALIVGKPVPGSRYEQDRSDGMQIQSSGLSWYGSHLSVGKRP